jgi:beta-phosphoglucomutase-like phosphatase (HAD superfamily)
MHVVMFDIDGTLVDSAGFDGELYAAAVREVIGVQIDQRWGRYEHVSDTRFDNDRAALAARVQEHFVGLVRNHLEARPKAVREIAGAKRLVERLRGLPDVRVAIATGGWEPTARMKLTHVGIDVSALGFATSSDARARTEIMQLAAQRALRGATSSRATYFGDGPWDQQASHELGYDFVAIGRGVSHPVVFDDFSDSDAILERLHLRA